LIAIVTYKCLLLGFGLVKAICTWHVVSSVSESKQFSVALAIGVFSYIMTNFLVLSTILDVFLNCVCNFMCSTLSVMLIMIPKLQKRSKVAMYRKGSQLSDSDMVSSLKSYNSSVVINDAKLGVVTNQRSGSIVSSFMRKFSMSSSQQIVSPEPLPRVGSTGKLNGRKFSQGPIKKNGSISQKKPSMSASVSGKK
jgi:hypothetical protein